MPENPLSALEIATRKVWVFASSEIIEELEKGWSRPIQAKVSGPNPDGSWEMMLRTSEGAEQRLAATTRQVLTEWPELGYDGQEYGHLYRQSEVDPLLERLEEAVSEYEATVRLTDSPTTHKAGC